MSSGYAAREQARKLNTPENIANWNKLYHDGIIDGDVIMLTDEWNGRPEGTMGIIEIRFDSRVQSPVRAIIFGEDDGVCGINHEGLEFIKLDENTEVEE